MYPPPLIQSSKRCTSCECPNYRSMIWPKPTCLHLTKELQSLFKEPHLSVSCNHSTPGNHISLRHFVEQLTCILDPADLHIPIYHSSPSNNIFAQTCIKQLTRQIYGITYRVQMYQPISHKIIIFPTQFYGHSMKGKPDGQIREINTSSNQERESIIIRGRPSM
uniref:Uncharacterized protein n=1 Tax=Opuntia streptacantha TaxID=393608 RepID=A0A7C9APB8_OPUST